MRWVLVMTILAVSVSAETPGRQPGPPGRPIPPPPNPSTGGSPFAPTPPKLSVDTAIELERTLRELGRRQVGLLIRAAVDDRRRRIRRDLCSASIRRIDSYVAIDAAARRQSLELVRIHEFAGAHDQARRAVAELARPGSNDWLAQAWRVDLTQSKKGRRRLAAKLAEHAHRSPDCRVAQAVHARTRGPVGRRTSFRRIAERFPDYWVGWAELARAELDCGDATAGLRAAQRCIELNPGSAYGHEILGRAWDRCRRISDAETAWKRALKLDPFHLPALQRLIHVSVRAGNASEARTRAAQAVRIAPKSLDCAERRAAVALLFGKPREAIETLRAMLHPDEAGTVAHCLLVHAYSDAGLHGLAIHQAQRATAKHPRNVNANRALLYAALAAERFVDADAAARALTRRGAADAETLLLAAATALERKDGTRAHRLVRRARAKKHEGPQFAAVHGAVLEGVADLKRATDCYTKLVEQSPRHFHAWARLAHLALARFDVDEAERCFDRSLERLAHPELVLAAAIFYDVHLREPATAHGLYLRYLEQGGKHPAVKLWIERTGR